MFFTTEKIEFKHSALCLQFIISFIVASIIEILPNVRFHREAFPLGNIKTRQNKTQQNGTEALNKNRHTFTASQYEIKKQSKQVLNKLP